jgi:hypothetical protein
MKKVRRILALLVVCLLVIAAQMPALASTRALSASFSLSAYANDTDWTKNYIDNVTTAKYVSYTINTVNASGPSSYLRLVKTTSTGGDPDAPVSASLNLATCYPGQTYDSSLYSGRTNTLSACLYTGSLSSALVSGTYKLSSVK